MSDRFFDLYVSKKSRLFNICYKALYDIQSVWWFFRMFLTTVLMSIMLVNIIYAFVEYLTLNEAMFKSVEMTTYTEKLQMCFFACFVLLIIGMYYVINSVQKAIIIISMDIYRTYQNKKDRS